VISGLCTKVKPFTVDPGPKDNLQAYYHGTDLVDDIPQRISASWGTESPLVSLLFFLKGISVAGRKIPGANFLGRLNYLSAQFRQQSEVFQSYGDWYRTCFFGMVMKPVYKNLIVMVLITLIGSFAANAQTNVPADQKQITEAFENRVKEYVKLREALEGKMPKLSKDATPEQIEAHKTAFQERMRTARAGAKPGELFTPDAANLIRSIIKNEFKGNERIELRQTVFEAETQGVAVRVNSPYPESKELVEMPPTLLLKLPQLPKQIRYRFVGNYLLLVDRENGLILDYMTRALP
jgi:hypothetical protein